MKITRPLLAICVYLGIGFLIAQYGTRDGSLILFDFIAGLLAYFLICSLSSRR